MVNDRGTKKWTSLMLPEHVEILKKVFAEQAYQTKPILDEQQVRENETTLKHAIHEDFAIEIKYFKNYEFKKAQGKVTNMNDHHLWIAHTKICLKDIIEVHDISSDLW